MKQLTAMQLMLWYLENEGLENSGAYYKAKHLLELEKEQIVGLLQWMNKVASETPMRLETDIDDIVEQYYNETYKK